jgi:hypothetical protein
VKTKIVLPISEASFIQNFLQDRNAFRKVGLLQSVVLLPFRRRRYVLPSREASGKQSIPIVPISAISFIDLISKTVV